MICLEVTINGERRTVAGVASAQTLYAEVCTYPELKDTWLQVDGEITPEDQPPADAHWLSAQLSVGDQVEIRIIESDQPSAPKVTRIEPTASASDAIPFVCAFCGKDHHQTEGMISSRKAMICRDCVCYLYEMITEDDTEPRPGPE